MDSRDQARIAISNGISALVARRATTTDAAERGTINQSISDLNDRMMELDSAELLAATEAVADATDSLETCIAAARTGPFDVFLSSIEGTIGQLQAAQSQLHAADKLPKAAPSPAATGSPTAPLPATGVLPPVNLSMVFADLESEYRQYFDACVPDPARAASLQFCTIRLQKSRSTYEATGTELGVPWYFVGLLHAMECAFNFGTHLHNGDPLTARTVHVPAGRPPTGSPPFGWQVSARDALIFEHYDHQQDWSLSRVLYRLEAYNGFGYRQRRLPTPYLWGFSNLYRGGKFVADGVFDANAVSQQCGAGVVLTALRRDGAV